jgi:hypothetical protein
MTQRVIALPVDAASTRKPPRLPLSTHASSVLQAHTHQARAMMMSRTVSCARRASTSRTRASAPMSALVVLKANTHQALHKPPVRLAMSVRREPHLLSVAMASMIAKTYALLAKRDLLEAAFCACLGHTRPHPDPKHAVHALLGPGANQGPLYVRARLGLQEQMGVLARAVRPASTRKAPAMANARAAERASIHLRRQLLVLACAKTVQKERTRPPQAGLTLQTALHAMLVNIRITSV